MSESSEPSYYEIALTSRQVLVSFVVLLSCVMAAFVSGVWVGRNGSDTGLPGEVELASAETGPADLADLEELKFFTEEEGGGAGMVGKPPEAPATDPKPATTLVQDVGAGGAPPPRAVPPPVAPPPPSQAAVTPPPSRATPPPPVATATASPATRPTDGLIIQVLSTREEARAKKMLALLRQGGYTAFLSPVEVGSEVNYRVRIGPFSERPPAEKVAQEVNRKYKVDTWITAASN